ncbi:hypothetical protein [Actinoplanes siamensis]|uniref:hypothetical protein n=1 Tax=Actinoplanes siamensis TaxID=1223317 RepID=UPI00194471F6|nr:hypothetical protein [Actinoplanes siamensis]
MPRPDPYYGHRDGQDREHRDPYRALGDDRNDSGHGGQDPGQHCPAFEASGRGLVAGTLNAADDPHAGEKPNVTNASSNPTTSSA